MSDLDSEKDLSEESDEVSICKTLSSIRQDMQDFNTNYDEFEKDHNIIISDKEVTGFWGQKKDISPSEKECDEMLQTDLVGTKKHIFTRNNKN